MELCRDEMPERYRDEEYCEEWELRHRPGLRRHLGFVRRRHERTDYRERGGEDSQLSRR